MAIDAHSTPAPADHRALLRTHGVPSRVLGKSATVADLEPSFAGAVPVPTPDLTAETVAILDAIPADVPHGGAPFAEIQTVGIPTVFVSQGDAAAQRQPHEMFSENDGAEISTSCISQGEAADVPHRGAGMTRHHGAPMCSAADLPCGDITTPALTVGVCCAVQQTAVADLPRGAASGVLSTVETTPADSRGDIGTTDLASALHMRRALEGALDHGTALLAALGLPSLVEPGFVPLDPAAIGDALDTAIATLDALDAPGADLEDEGEAEPSLGWIDGKPVLSDSHDDREAEDDDEPILGAPERHPQSGPWGPQRDISGSQTDWADGSARHDEAEAVNEDGGDILDEGEETLGWAANVSQLALGQTTADGDATALERHGRGFLRSGPDDAEDGGDAERDDEHGSEDGEDIGHFARDWRSVIRDIQREREAAHV